MARARYLTIMIVPDGTEARRGYRIRRSILQLILIAFGLLLIGIVLFFVFYGKVLALATSARSLKAENENLLRYQLKVQMLEENLKQARGVVGRLTELAGIEFSFPELPNDSVFFASLDNQHPAVLNRSYRADFSFPSGLPVQGFISRDFDIENPDRYHPGVDIACAEGTPVLATAKGYVEYASYDSTYGYMVVVRHSDSVRTLYGHNATLLVEAGQDVAVGGRLALSGNTGISTAPHVHYEVRINDEPIDPLESPHDETNQ